CLTASHRCRVETREKYPRTTRRRAPTEPPMGIGPMTSVLPRLRSTTELRGQRRELYLLSAGVTKSASWCGSRALGGVSDAARSGLERLPEQLLGTLARLRGGDEPTLVAEDRVGDARELRELGARPPAPGLGQELARAELGARRPDRLQVPVARR